MGRADCRRGLQGLRWIPAWAGWTVGGAYRDKEWVGQRMGRADCRQGLQGQCMWVGGAYTEGGGLPVWARWKVGEAYRDRKGFTAWAGRGPTWRWSPCMEVCRRRPIEIEMDSCKDRRQGTHGFLAWAGGL